MIVFFAVLTVSLTLQVTLWSLHVFTFSSAYFKHQMINTSLPQHSCTSHCFLISLAQEFFLVYESVGFKCHSYPFYI